MFKPSPSLFGACAPIAALLGVVAMAGCAAAEPYNPSRLPAAQLSQVQQICHAVLGIPAGVGLATDCVGALSESAVAMSRARDMQAARQVCLAKGLQPGGTEQPQCELSAASERADVRINTAALDPVGKSYYSASSREIHRREQTACARLGYDPIDGGSFAKCVAGLDSALFASEHVAQ
jgi:hypothetical protein